MTAQAGTRPRRGAQSGSAFSTRALLLRATPYGERDLIAAFFTEQAGMVTAMLRNGHSGGKQAGGAVEPFHELQMTFVDEGRDFVKLREGAFGRLRRALVEDLDGMDGAGELLRWVRTLASERTPDPEPWRVITEALDALDVACSGGDNPTETDRAKPKTVTEFSKLRLLAAFGYGLRFDGCVHCGAERPEGRPAYFAVTAGGVVCSDCQASRFPHSRLTSSALLSLAAACQGGAPLLALAAVPGSESAATAFARVTGTAFESATSQSAQRGRR